MERFIHLGVVKQDVVNKGVFSHCDEGDLFFFVYYLDEFL